MTKKRHHHHSWTGDKASYNSKHQRVRRYFGKPSHCEHCKTTEDRMYHWANKKGDFSLKRTNWLRLCVPCHRLYDKDKNKSKFKIKLNYKLAQEIRDKYNQKLFNQKQLSEMYKVSYANIKLIMRNKIWINN